METEPIWFPYATFDEEGFVNGIRADAPAEAKAAYQKEKDQERWYKDHDEPIPR